jgi:hypothetical protein
LFLGRTPRRRLRKPAHERHPFESMEAVEPSAVSCGIFVVGFLFILFVLAFILLKSGGYL